MRIIISNAVWGRLSENYLTQKFIAQNIFGTKYSQFTVYEVSISAPAQMQALILTCIRINALPSSQSSVYILIQLRYRAQTATVVLGVFNLQILPLFYQGLIEPSAAQ